MLIIFCLQYSLHVKFKYLYTSNWILSTLSLLVLMRKVRKKKSSNLEVVYLL